MSDDRIIITGVTGGVVPRLEITDLVKIDDQFSLFVQALIKMQAGATTDYSSHYSIGGIHGFPFRAWGGSDPEGPVSGAPSDTNWDGYCTHGSVLFPTWHRPYVALFEQTLCSHAQEIAKGYPDQARWTTAAKQLRLPYWDWVERPVPPPEVIELDTLSILMPDGKKASVKNPLTSYNFKGAEKDFPSAPGSLQDWTTFPQTVRYPGYPTPVQTLKSRLQSTAEARRENVERLFNHVKKWDDFSNHTVSKFSTSNKSNSLEAIHDSIHVIVGAGGHMNDPLVAGFDPIFFLHHCNVDRVLALWQAANPNTFVSPGSAQEGTWSIPVDATIDENTPLTPFWSGSGPDSYWVSTSARSWESLGYTYPDFQGAPTQADVTNLVQKMTSPQKPTPGRIVFPHAAPAPAPPAQTPSAQPAHTEQSAHAQPTSAGQPHPTQQPRSQHTGQSLLGEMVDKFEAAIHSFEAQFEGGPAPHSRSLGPHQGQGHGGNPSGPGHAGPPHPSSPGHVAHPGYAAPVGPPVALGPSGAHIDPANGFLDWTARVHCKKFELRESFVVHLFLKPPPEDPIEWIGADGHVGSHYVFVNSSFDQCANCVERKQTINEGFIQLNTAIAKYSDLNSYDIEVVAPYLKEALEWRVQKADLRTPIPTVNLPSLEIEIMSARVHVAGPFGNNIPIESDVKIHPDITAGRPGGARA